MLVNDLLSKRLWIFTVTFHHHPKKSFPQNFKKNNPNSRSFIMDLEICTWKTARSHGIQRAFAVWYSCECEAHRSQHPTTTRKFRCVLLHFGLSVLWGIGMSKRQGKVHWFFFFFFFSVFLGGCSLFLFSIYFLAGLLGLILPPAHTDIK